MPITEDEILKRVKKIEKENVDAKPARKARKELWKIQSLEESLYNTENDGRIPRAQDVDQGSYSYVIKGQGHDISNCYLLTNLMGLAKKRPDFIMNNLIKVDKRNKDLVKVGLFRTKKVKESNRVTVKSEGTRLPYLVSKDEALRWKTRHKALWVVVVEIAYAKHLRADKTIENLSVEDNSKLRDELKNGLPAVALTQLTGFKSEYSYLEATNDSGKPGYSAAALDIYSKIEQKTKAKKIISVSFRGSQKKSSAVTNSQLKKVDKDTIAAFVIKYSKELKSDAKKAIQSLKDKYGDMFNNYKCNEWLEFKLLQLCDNPLLEQFIMEVVNFRNRRNHKKPNPNIVINLKKDAKKSIKSFRDEGMLINDKYNEWLESKLWQLCNDSLRKKFIMDVVNFEGAYTISKNSLGIKSEHACLVLGVKELEGYKYVILRNPYDMETKIDYHSKKKNGIPKKVELPNQIDKEKNECMMELNHFHKKLLSIHYN